MKNIFFSFFIVLGSCLYGQNTVKGIVTDQENNPLNDVQIYIEQLHTGTTSDENGAYELNQIPNGSHQLTFNYLGYNIETFEISLSNEPLEMNVELTEGIFHMDEIIVSTPFHKKQHENIIKVDYKNLEELKKSGGITLIESITSIPGVGEISTGTGIGKPVIRGLSGNRVLVYTQGVRLENYQYGGEHGLGVNEAGIESVEVIKGPASLLYGSDALGGVLYLNPEKFALSEDTSFNLDQAFFSNTSGSNTSFGVKSSPGKFKLLGRGTYNTHLDYKIPNGQTVTNTRYNEKDLKLGAGLNTGNYVSEFRYNYNKSEIGITEGIEDQSDNRTPELPYQDIKTHIFSLHNHLFINDSKLDFDLGYVENQRREYEEHHHDEHENEEDEEDEHEEDEHEEDEHEEEDEDAPINMRLGTFSYALKYHLPNFNKFESVVGIQGMHQRNVNFGEEYLIPNAKTIDFGLYTSVLYALSETSQLQGGIRFDNRKLNTESYEVEIDHEHHEVEALDLDFNNFTFSLGSKFDIKKTITTRINLATGFRAPNLAELTSLGVHHGTNRFEIGNPDLESEQSFQFDLELEYGSKHIEAYVRGFYNRIKDYIYLEPTGNEIDGFDVYQFVQNNSELYGGEVGFHFHPHPLDWLHLESNFETVTGVQDNGDYLPLIPANKFTNTIRTEFDLNDKITDLFFSVTLQSYFEKTDVNPLEEATDAYNLLNFVMGTNIVLNNLDLQLQLNVNNALNETYIAHLSRLKTFGIPNMGRNIMFGLNFTL